MKPVTKAELARRLHVHRTTISGYVRRGLPVQADGRVDPSLAAGWIEANIHAQAGARGAGVRGAAELAADPEPPPQTNGAKNGHHKSADLLEQSVRLTAARAQNIELRNRQLAGGTEQERTLRLIDTIAAHCWWQIQRCSPWGLEAGISDLSGLKDPTLRYRVRDLIVGRDELLAERVRQVVADGLNGRLELVRGEMTGSPGALGLKSGNPKMEDSMVPKVLGLTDSQYLAICRACDPLQPHERSELLAKLADHLRAVPDVGDGELFRLLRELVHQTWRPPTISEQPRHNLTTVGEPIA
jgi:hypothetical protein